LWYIQFIGKREYPHRTSFSACTIDSRLTQVASLASRHEQSIVHAAFFLLFTPPSFLDQFQNNHTLTNPVILCPQGVSIFCTCSVHQGLTVMNGNTFPFCLPSQRDL
jgi:hypothetical protein